MTAVCFSASLPSADETANLARSIAALLHPGDCVLLSGPIGAGKTHFARSAIQSLLVAPEDVPSPTYTLVQVYDHAKGGEIWHADLYRLASVEDVLELGLEDGWRHGVCLIEWPDRLGTMAPTDALTIEISPRDDVPEARILIARWEDPKWTKLKGLFDNECP